MPTGYSVLSVPPKWEMRKKGYDPDQLTFNGGEAHPLATWKSYSLPANASYKDALLKLQEVNKKPWGLLRARLHFSDGQIEMFERRHPNVPGSFSNVRTYDPNGVFNQETNDLAAKRHKELVPRLKFLTDDKGHYIGTQPRPRTFASQELYKNCPPPVHSQCGYDFTPMSHNSFLLRPADPPKGVRAVQSDFEKKPCDYRPRSYLREGPVDSRHCHCAEVYQVGDYTQDLARQTDVVNGRNRLVKREFTHLQTQIPNSTIIGKRNARDPRFPCISKSSQQRRAEGATQQQQRGEGPPPVEEAELAAVAAPGGEAMENVAMYDV